MCASEGGRFVLFLYTLNFLFFLVFSYTSASQSVIVVWCRTSSLLSPLLFSVLTLSVVVGTLAQIVETIWLRSHQHHVVLHKVVV